MKSVFFTLIFVLLLPLPLLAGGDDPLHRKNTISQLTLVKEEENVLLSTLNGFFQDGTVEEVFSLIEKVLGKKVNIVIHPSAKDVRIPAFAVNSANALMISSLISNLVVDLDIRVSIGGEFMPVQHLLKEIFEGEKLLNIFDGGETQEARSVPVLLIKLDEEDKETGKEIERNFRIFRMDLLLQEGAPTIDDIGTAIETAWGMIPRNYSANLKFHKETNLLICSGTDEQLDVFDEIIEALESKRKSPPVKQKEGIVEERLQEMGMKMQALENKLDELKKENAALRVELKKAREKGIQPAGRS